MKRKLKLFITLLLAFSAMPVFAEASCGAFSEITRPAVHVIMIAAPILVLVLGGIDFLKATTASDQKGISKAINTTFKRLLICMVILLLPLIVNMIMGWTNFNNLTACL